MEDRQSILELVDAKVDLVLNSFSNPLATGTVNGRAVHVTGSLYPGPHDRPGFATGSVAGQPLEAIFTIKDQTPHGSGYVTTARLTASVGANALVLSGTFNLDENYNFVNGTIVGSDRGLEVDVSAKPYSWSGNIGYGATIRGHYAGSATNITVKVPPGPGLRGSVKGTVGSETVDLDIHAGQQLGTRLAGSFSGPAELLAVIAGAVAAFAP